MQSNILKDNSLQNLVRTLKIDEESRSLLIEKIPQMNLEERIGLWKDLADIYLLDLEEEEALKNLRKFWKKD
ncbi:hypothetical protein C4572_02760 [Candidatus Parcubacteria bacterium]|nr:MAG: hypothetical protein C4572_02760 [Candidatus Parcubacteria bacterium]